jgi:hypothetical protein
MDTLTLVKIKEFVRNQIQESLHLEYKACADLIGNVDIHELSKDVSAFANADGGTLIFGVVEGSRDRKHLPERVDEGFERGGKVNANWLENVLLSNIAPKIQGLKPYEIPLENGKFILVLEVPQSQYGPHMAKDHKYYKRRQTKAEPMEHYEVEDVRNRSRGPLLRLNVSFDHDEFTPMGIKHKFFETERSFPIKLFAENLVSQPAEYGAVNFFLDFQLREREKMLQSKMYYSNELGLAVDGRYGFYRHYFQIGLPHNAPIWKDNPVLVQEIPFSFPKDLNAMETFYFGWDISSPYMPKQRKFFQMQTIIDRPGTTSIYGISEI